MLASTTALYETINRSPVRNTYFIGCDVIYIYFSGLAVF